jgi:hypothetical protein
MNNIVQHVNYIFFFIYFLFIFSFITLYYFIESVD